ncbi:TrmB family transcriptional regulator [Candidatus Woesearchaeota archaeon]|nr:TrmB family transcriptional regulator [Candidatus Woesearchaeota archaeon]
MIVQKDFLNKLKDFGLNSYESKLWIALLSRGVSTAGELSDISNVPRSRAYDVLESLEKKGFIIVKVGKPIKYLAVPPAEVVERVKKKVFEDAELQNKILSSLKGSEVLDELNTLHTEGIKLVDPTDRSGAFRGREKVYEHLVTLIKNAQKSVVVMTTKEGFERKYDVLNAPLKKAAKAGVDVRFFVPQTANKDLVKEAQKFASVKFHKDENCTRFCIVDKLHLVFMLTDDKKVHKSYDSGVWVEAPQFAEYFTSLFEKEWKNG